MELHRSHPVKSEIPVLTVDGPSGAGKGAVSRAVAKALGWHYLDSGAIYRVLALAVLRRKISLDDAQALASAASSLDLAFHFDNDEMKTMLDGSDVSDMLQSPACADTASRIAAQPAVRAALLEKQRAFRKKPGLVADGRDMGTVVFPGAAHKLFLTANSGVRAERRYKQLKAKGIDVNLEILAKEMSERDRRDMERRDAPLAKAQDAVLIDTSDLTITEVVAAALRLLGRA